MKKFAVDSSQRDYFSKNQLIEFEGLIPEEQIPSIQEALRQELERRTGKSPSTIEELFAHGRDLWRGDTLLKKWITHPQFANIAGELCEKRKLRIGFDQYLPTPTSFVMIPAIKNLYHYLEGKLSLIETSSLQGVVCGLILCLKAPSSKDSPSKLFTEKEGSGIYFTADLPLDFTEIEKRIGGEYILIVYTEPNAVYIHQVKDPQSTTFKKLGYTYGDKLSDKLNPKVLK